MASLRVLINLKTQSYTPTHVITNSVFTVHFAVTLYTMSPSHGASRTAPVTDAVLRQGNNASCATGIAIGCSSLRFDVYHVA